jgi:carnosine synthase
MRPPSALLNGFVEPLNKGLDSTCTKYDISNLTELDYSKFDSIPKELLEERSFLGQETRTNLLRGSTILFFCAGYPGKRFIYEQAHKRGVKAIIIDNHDSWSRELLECGTISGFVGIDMSRPVEEVLEAALLGIRNLGVKVDGVCTFVELSVSIAARLARALGLPGPDPDCVESARDKSVTRSVMKEAGLPNVKNILINSEEDLPAAAAYIGFPAVLKPVSGAASLGVQKVSSENELLKVYRAVSRTLSGLIISAGALERRKEHTDESGKKLLCGNGTVEVNASCVINITVIMEEYLDGFEVDVDMLLSDGVCRYAKVIDNGPTYEPYFAETWASVPSLLPPVRVEELEALAIASVQALGFANGVYHVELKYTSRGPRLIEVNARMGGGPTRMIHKLVSGIDLVLEQFFISVGIPSRPLFSAAPLVHVAYAFINARKSGSVQCIEFMKRHEEQKNVVWVLPYVKPFEQVVGPEAGHPTWLGDVVVQHADGHEALRIVKKIEDTIATEFTDKSMKPLLFPNL